jgi:RNA polymerase sigma-70 factor (ECF subfamily)
LIRRETIAAVRQALGELPGEQRQVVWARMYEDKTFLQIAQESDLPLGTVLTRMRLALEKLRRILRTGE